MGREDREEKHVKCKLKRHKMEHNPRNGGKFLKVTLRFKTGYISTLSKKKCKNAKETSGVTEEKSPGKCSMKIKFFTSKVSGLNRALYSSRQECLLLVSRMQLVKDTQRHSRAILTLHWSPWRPVKFQAAHEAYAQQLQDVQVWPFLPQTQWPTHSISYHVPFCIFKYGSIF